MRNSNESIAIIIIDNLLILMVILIIISSAYGISERISESKSSETQRTELKYQEDEKLIKK